MDFVDRIGSAGRFGVFRIQKCFRSYISNQVRFVSPRQSDQNSQNILTSGNKYKSIYSIWRSRGFLARNPEKATCYFSQVPLPAPSRWGFKQSATQPGCMQATARLRHPPLKVHQPGSFPHGFSENLREVGSIDPLLEGTGDQSMGCLVMHPDEADLTAGVCFEKFHQN